MALPCRSCFIPAVGRVSGGGILSGPWAAKPGLQASLFPVLQRRKLCLQGVVRRLCKVTAPLSQDSSSFCHFTPRSSPRPLPPHSSEQSEVLAKTKCPLTSPLRSAPAGTSPERFWWDRIQQPIPIPVLPMWNLCPCFCWRGVGRSCAARWKASGLKGLSVTHGISTSSGRMLWGAVRGEGREAAAASPPGVHPVCSPWHVLVLPHTTSFGVQLTQMDWIILAWFRLPLVLELARWGGGIWRD